MEAPGPLYMEFDNQTDFLDLTPRHSRIAYQTAQQHYWADDEEMSSPHLLGLPLELRLSVYEYLLHGETHVCGSKETTFRATDEGTRYLTPWCNATLVCRQFHTELREFMDKRRDTPLGQTWTVQLSAPTPPGRARPLKRTLPCTPINLRTVWIDVPYDSTPDLVSRVGPYAAFINLMRSGPALNHNRQEVELSSVRELILNCIWLGREQDQRQRLAICARFNSIFRTRHDCPELSTIQRYKFYVDEVYQFTDHVLHGDEDS